MKPKLYTALLLLAISWCHQRVLAQDPVFSQFYASPLTVNPALAGNGDAAWRLVGIHRSQWIASGVDPLNTTSLSFDGKLFRQKDNEVNYIGGGIAFLQDRGMSGAYKNTSFNAILSSHVSLDAEDMNGLSVGIGGTYSNTYIDFAALSFPSQLSSSGFNRALPTTEPYLSNIKPYFALSGGVDYTFSSETMGFDIGVAGYRFMKTHRSALNDKDQIDPPRYNIHANYQTYLSDRIVLNANGMYIVQTNLNSFTVGMNLGTILTDPSEESPTVLNTGLWYRKNEAIIPYLGLTLGSVTAGFTYDVASGSSKGSLNSLKTMEFSLILRSPQKKSRPIPCPWK